MSTPSQRAERKRTGQGVWTPPLFRRVEALEAQLAERDRIIAKQDFIIKKQDEIIESLLVHVEVEA